VRPAVTATTGGAANIPVSMAEDALSTVTSVLSVLAPVLIGAFLILIAILILWYLIRRRQKAAVY